MKKFIIFYLISILFCSVLFFAFNEYKEIIYQIMFVNTFTYFTMYSIFAKKTI